MNLSLKNKILLLSLLPLVFFILLGFNQNYQTYKVFDNSKDVAQNMEFAKITSNLIHESQKERGASGGYLGGGLTINKLNEQRNNTDKYRNKLIENIDLIQFDQKYKNLMINNVKKYENLRSEVSANRIGATESVKKYTEIISILIDYNAKAAKSTIFGETAAAIRTLQSLELVKEFSGKLRAVTTNYIAKNKPLSDHQIRKMQALMAGVVVSINSKALTFSSKANDFKEQFLKSSEWKNTVESYNVLISKKEIGNFGIDTSQHFKTMTGAVDKLNKLIKYQLEETLKIVNDKKSEAFNQFVLLSSFIGGLSLFMILLVFKISKGLINDLTNITSRMVSGIVKISELTEHISTYSEDLSVSSEQQASSMQETAATMNEIHAMVKRNATDADSSSTVAVNSFSEVQNGVKKMKQMSTALESINSSNEKVTTQIDTSNEKMNEISKIIKSIGEKTKVINDIVFQTKLLSFNASVEAARAGEHGKGFSVVAEEIGNLAQMSGQAADEIYKMLEESINSVEKVSAEQKQEMQKLTDESKKNIEHGLEIGSDSEEFLSALLNQMDSLKESVQQISIASSEQSNGVDEVTQAIQEVNEATRTNTNISHETSKISSDLKDNMNNFNNIVSDLEMLVSSTETNIDSVTKKIVSINEAIESDEIEESNVA